MNKLSKICFPILYLIIGCDNEPESNIITWQSNYNKWLTKNMVNYEFNFRASCFCIDEWVREVKITVINDTVKSVLFTDNNLPPQELGIEQWPTINSLFYLSKAALEEAELYEFKYDNTYGNPREISIDWNSQIADDEVVFFIANVKKN